MKKVRSESWAFNVIRLRLNSTKEKYIISYTVSKTFNFSQLFRPTLLWNPKSTPQSMLICGAPLSNIGHACPITKGTNKRQETECVNLVYIWMNIHINICITLYGTMSYLLVGNITIWGQLQFVICIYLWYYDWVVLITQLVVMYYYVVIKISAINSFTIFLYRIQYFSCKLWIHNNYYNKCGHITTTIGMGSTNLSIWVKPGASQNLCSFIGENIG